MKAKIINSKNSVEIRKVEITIGDNQYTLTETIDGKLTVNKNDGDDGTLSIFPRVSNVIDIL